MFLGLICLFLCVVFVSGTPPNFLVVVIDVSAFGHFYTLPNFNDHLTFSFQVFSGLRLE